MQAQTIRIDFLDGINDRVKKGEYWGKNGAIKFALKNVDLLGEEYDFEGLSTLSAVLYSAGMKAYAYWRLSPRWLPNLPAGIRYHLSINKAEKYSDLWLKRMKGRSPSPEMLLIRAEILFSQQKYREAEFVTEEAFGKKDIHKNTRALLLVVLAKNYWAQGFRGRAIHQYELASDMMYHIGEHAFVRVSTALAENFFDLGKFKEARIHAQSALDVAHMEGFSDLAFKLEPVLDKLRKHQ